jgi:pimeloyl-ACP methyl ester carboxylesterase
MLKVTENKTICYNQKGDSSAPTVLLLHGLGCSREYFSFFMNDVNIANYQLIAPDFLGFGGSSKPKSFSYRMKDQAETIKKFIEKLNLKVEVLVGFSMGGAISSYLSQDLPVLKQLIMVEPALVKSDSSFSRWVQKLPPFIITFGNLLSHIFPRIALKRAIKGKNKQAKEIVLTAFHQTPAFVLQRASKWLVDAVENSEPYNLFAKINCEKHYILSDSLLNDPERFNPPEDLFEISTKHVIDNAGHGVMLDNPDQFNQTMLEILGKK